MEGTEYTIASPGKRILAYIVDSMFMSIASIIILFLIGQGDGLSAIANYSGADIEQIIEKVLPMSDENSFTAIAHCNCWYCIHYFGNLYSFHIFSA